jgi:hypothetical protein
MIQVSQVDESRLPIFHQRHLLFLGNGIDAKDSIPTSSNMGLSKNEVSLKSIVYHHFPMK